MSEFKVLITTDSAAFAYECGGDFNSEVARILREVADKVDAGRSNGIIRDINGVRVGGFEYAEDGTD